MILINAEYSCTEGMQAVHNCDLMSVNQCMTDITGSMERETVFFIINK